MGRTKEDPRPSSGRQPRHRPTSETRGKPDDDDPKPIGFINEGEGIPLPAKTSES